MCRGLTGTGRCAAQPMVELVATRGLPASGKTTWAVGWVAEDYPHRARVNRDDLRAMLHNSVYLEGSTESRVVAARDAAVRSLLAAGVSVVCDDTNLAWDIVSELAALAADAGAVFRVQDFTDVPVAECVRRDAARPKPVGEEVIVYWAGFLSALAGEVRAWP